MKLKNLVIDTETKVVRFTLYGAIQRSEKILLSDKQISRVANTRNRDDVVEGIQKMITGLFVKINSYGVSADKVVFQSDQFSLEETAKIFLLKEISKDTFSMVRTFRALRGAKFHYMYEVYITHFDELLRIPNFGRKCATDVKEVFEQNPVPEGFKNYLMAELLFIERKTCAEYEVLTDSLPFRELSLMFAPLEDISTWKLSNLFSLVNEAYRWHSIYNKMFPYRTSGDMERNRYEMAFTGGQRETIRKLLHAIEEIIEKGVYSNELRLNIIPGK